MIKKGRKINNNEVLRPILLFFVCAVFWRLFRNLFLGKKAKVKECVKSSKLKLQLQMGLHLGLQNAVKFVVIYRGYLYEFGCFKGGFWRVEGVLLQVFFAVVRLVSLWEIKYCCNFALLNIWKKMCKHRKQFFKVI